MATEALSVQGLWKRYGRVQALRGVSFSVEEGRIHALIGPNGAGKTTTVKIIMGLVKPDSGSIRVFGEDVTSGCWRVRRRIGFMPEIPNLPSWATVGDVIVKYGLMYGLSYNDSLQAGRRALELVGMLDYWSRRVSKLSKGQKQRVSLAQAIMHEPELLILDEPMLGLDPKGMVEVRSLIKKVAGEGATVLLNTHLLKEAEDLCDTATVLDGGRVLFNGFIDELKIKASGEASIEVVLISNAGKAAAELESSGLVKKAVAESERRVIIKPLEADEESRARILEFLVENGFRVIEYKLITATLEEAFLKITRGE